MSKKVEIEQKYYCTNHDGLFELIKKNKFNKKSESYESDEYFTDIDSTYIKDRTCLRIRKSDNQSLELTFKGKSKQLTNNYAKIETNIPLDIADYDNLTNLLYSLGYYSYSVVNKKRITYTKTLDDYEYNIMIDTIEDLGDFAEFEMLYYKDERDIGYLQNKLNLFVKKFESLNFESADLPYRDFVANKTYINVLPKDKLTTILFDLDGTLINSEKKFFESFRKVIMEKFDYSITYAEYENNELKKNANLIPYLKEKKVIKKQEKQENIMKCVYSEYENKFIELLDENEVSLNFELLKRIKEKGIRMALVSTSRRKFIDILLNHLNIENLFEIIVSREDVSNLKPAPDAYIMALELLGVSSDNCIAFEDSQRGICASNSANIKTIGINDFVKDDKFYNTEVSGKLSRILLALINWIGK